jgi:hypothetical protein
MGTSINGHRGAPCSSPTLGIDGKKVDYFRRFFEIFFSTRFVNPNGETEPRLNFDADYFNRWIEDAPHPRHPIFPRKRPKFDNYFLPDEGR